MKHLIIVCLILTVALVSQAQNFELRLVEEEAQVRVQMRSIDEHAPTTSDVFHDMTFGICWNNRDLRKFVVLESDYVIQTAGIVNEKGGKSFQGFAAMAMPMSPGTDWQSRKWVDIAILAPEGGSKWEFNFINQLDVAPMGYDLSVNPNVGYNQTDYEPVIREHQQKFDILDFEVARHKEAVAELFWHANEHDNLKSYVVERSPDGEHWREVGIVYRDNGNYRFTDYTLEGITRDMVYRLRINDKFGAYEYSEEREISFDPGLMIYPNPAVDQITVEFTGRTTLGADGLVIFDSQGRIVYSQDILPGSGKEVIELSNTSLASGMYFVEFRKDETAVWVEKFELMR